mgnify:CR=1 FL=1
MKLNLTIKISLVFSALIAVSCTALLISNYFSGKDILSSQSVARYNSIAANLAFNAEYGVLTKNKQTLGKVLRGVMQEKDVNYVQVADRAGNVGEAERHEGHDGCAERHDREDRKSVV